jgi:fructose-1,6-bisphosphatase/inositol monophosphatase family enzyme
MTILREIQSRIESNLGRILDLKSERVKKPDDSYVTEGDLLVQELAFDVVRNSMPGAAVVSEELEEMPPIADLQNGDVIIIDPVDGTENFTSGLPEWGVSLCHYRDGHHVESLLLCPEMRLSVGSGDHVSPQRSRIAGISSSLTKEDILALEPGFEYRIIGCCVLNMLNVVRGAYATFENPKGAKVWDIIAGLNLALEHGHSVTVEGQPYRGQLLDPKGRYKFRVVSKFHRGGNP